MHNHVLDKLRQELESHADENTKANAHRFFKEDVNFYGVKIPLIEKIAKTYSPQIRHFPKSEIWTLCESLWLSGFFEEAIVACQWSYALRADYSPEDFPVFERWVTRYVTNWATCDTLCNHTVGTFIDMYPEYVHQLKDWTGSSNRWNRRAAAVTLVLPARHGKFLSDIFVIADSLLLDQDDLVQKGYGWLLKEASKAHRQEVFEYVMKHKHHMPRTAFRYAIEKMPPELRHQAMER